VFEKIDSMHAEFNREQADLNEAADKARNADNEATEKRWNAEVLRHKNKVNELNDLLNAENGKLASYKKENLEWTSKLA
jgi:peptide subunit release factor 1 (eRF1)